MSKCQLIFFYKYIREHLHDLMQNFNYDITANNTKKNKKCSTS
jgi:hypothetical protein